MDWTQQTDELMKGWTEAQKQFWSSWMGLLGTAKLGSMSSMFDPNQWMKALTDTWSGTEGGAAERVAGNLLGTPDVMMRSMSLLMQAWQAVAPKMEAGKAWKPDLEQLLERWQKEMADFPQRQGATATEFANLATTLFERWSPMTGPWMAMVSQAMAGGHPGAAFLGGSAGLNRVMGFDEGVAPILMGLGELPRGTVVREKMGTMLKAADAMTDLRAAQGEYHQAMAGALAKAIERTMARLAAMAEEGKKITSVRDLMRTWFTTADGTLNEVFTSAEFGAVRDKMITSLMTYKIRQRDAFEVIYAALEIPTRSEVDEAYRDIHGLKREIRMLNRKVKELTERAPEKRRRAPRSSPPQSPEDS
jgi:class III poly(R)-hydroxyalkanoic acid synthase PhaE subunit